MNQLKLPLITLEIKYNSIGWLHMTINNHHFCISYLNDFINDMKDVLVFKDDNYDMAVHRNYFDGEGVDLYLTSWCNDNLLFISWEYYGESHVPEIELMSFNYDDFIKEFDSAFMKINDKYWTQFDLDSINKEDK